MVKRLGVLAPEVVGVAWRIGLDAVGGPPVIGGHRGGRTVSPGSERDQVLTRSEPVAR